MWVITPVKAFKNAKLRLAEVLSAEQRAHFSYLMLEDILQTLHTSDDVDGVTLISSDQSVNNLAEHYEAGFLLTDSDSGYSEDAMHGISMLSKQHIDTIAIIPADVPQLEHGDLSRLNKIHNNGMTLCPAVIDGGTNCLLFSPPLTIPLMFGENSLHKYEAAANENKMPVKKQKIVSLERDIDRPGDLLWLKQQENGGKAWSYIRELEIAESCTK